MAETDDAYTLVSQYRHPMEGVYADYANSMKHLANQARIEETKAGKIAYNKEAKRKYQTEVDKQEAENAVPVIKNEERREGQNG